MSFVHNLVLVLQRLFELTSSINDRDHALKIWQSIISSTPRDNLARPNILGGFACALYSRTGAVEYLDLAIELFEEALELSPLYYTERAGYFSNMVTALRHPFRRIESMDDINRTANASEQALSYPDRTACLNALGTVLQRRYLNSGARDDLDGSIRGHFVHRARLPGSSGQNQLPWKCVGPAIEASGRKFING
jgi:tetratricopeptide (TPR) repeat protein